MRRSTVLSFGWSWLLAGCGAAQVAVAPPPSMPVAPVVVRLADDAATRLGRAIQADVDSTLGAGTWFGAEVRSARTGEILVSRNADKRFMPASNLKLFTTSTALRDLGPEFRYTTDLVATAPVSPGGVVRGDLVLVGSGDPSISGRFTDNDVTRTFRDFADSLKARGVRRVTGAVLGDDNVFDEVPYGPGWAWDDMSYYYSAQIGGLAFNDNCVDLTVRPGRIGAAPTVQIVPSTRYITIRNESRTVAAGRPFSVDYERLPGTNIIRVFGDIPADHGDELESITVHNPTAFTATVLREALVAAGIRIDGAALDADERATRPDSARFVRLARYTSPPLSALVSVVNKRSQNFYAEQILRTLGRQSAAHVGSFEAGLDRVRHQLREIGVAADSVALFDGSGLSRLDLITPHAVATLLAANAGDSAFVRSLPIAAVDGSMKNRLRGTAAAGRVRAKTGYVGHVRTLSGYALSADGEPLVFTFLFNHYWTGDRPDPTNALHDRLCLRLATFAR